jgi:hypothetical protein
MSRLRQVSNCLIGGIINKPFADCREGEGLDLQNVAALAMAQACIG